MLRPSFLKLLLGVCVGASTSSSWAAAVKPYGLKARAAIGPFLNGRLPDVAPSDRGLPPPLLSQAGVFEDLGSLKPADGLIPYGVNSAQWSDGAVKSRWIALPNDGAPYGAGEVIQFSPTGDWSFPKGTVFVEHLELPIDGADPRARKRLETRLLVLGKDGGAYGVAYRWRADNSDADLLVRAEMEDVLVTGVDGKERHQIWPYPSRRDCLRCHTPDANFVLGVKARHLNGDISYPREGFADIV
ncbi:MAG: hypothetical protein HYZ74_08585, partial [Elusimicrobia bacterium]|nr:hypothetical protein [Elusimicrobiota bacterium]